MTSVQADSNSSTPSTPPSPATTMTSAQSDAVDNSLDDIFGSSPPRERREEPVRNNADSNTTAEPSDLPSLRRQHVTAGYRDGVSASKSEHVQRGFDAGFPVGAQLGMRAGTILGILEGILHGLEDRSSSGVVKKPPPRGTSMSTEMSTDDSTSVEMAEARRKKKEEVLGLYQMAVKELDVQSVFTGAEAGSPANIEKTGERAETQLAQKADPVIARWEERVAVPRWEENMEALEEKEKEGGQGDKESKAAQS
ncbi:Essential protein Yae1 N-terminal [Penicillium riverlandense]|uniref:Essential protein Yae1 N-terminal n=1 Tax=Penicillium riverlandense TaxID=1903569 RepID=UPI002546AD90|nr:Essential protein Yae1 N-terminal [Penicillium riverlandense]KAJ5820314.1 Essential protein Yae1 N-terminal [Penicillium riverlandense]